jgi:hypothetical protein
VQNFNNSAKPSRVGPPLAGDQLLLVIQQRRVLDKLIEIQ